MKKRPILLALAVLILLVLAIALNGFVRETLAPILLAWVWRVSLMSRGFPQVIVWAFFIAIIPIIAVFSLIQERKEIEAPPPAEEVRSEGQVRVWAKLLRQAREGDYFRGRLNRRLARLVLDTLVYQERLTGEETKKLLREGELDISPEMRQFVEKGLRTRLGDGLAKSGRRTKRNGSSAPVWNVQEIEPILQFLEDGVEVKREG